MNRIRSLSVKRAQRAVARSEDARHRSDVTFDRAHETLAHGDDRRRQRAAVALPIDAATEAVLRRRLGPCRPPT